MGPRGLEKAKMLAGHLYTFAADPELLEDQVTIDTVSGTDMRPIAFWRRS